MSYIPHALGVLALTAVVVLLVPRRVSGAWLSREAGVRGSIKVVQTGPSVRARRKVPGGDQHFEGWIFGTRLTLSRRDYGVRHLAGMGFPDGLIPQLEGRVFARYSLKVAGDRRSLSGVQRNLKVYFHHHPPRILKMEMVDRGDVEWRRGETASGG